MKISGKVVKYISSDKREYDMSDVGCGATIETPPVDVKKIHDLKGGDVILVKVVVGGGLRSDEWIPVNGVGIINADNIIALVPEVEKCSCDMSNTHGGQYIEINPNCPIHGKPSKIESCTEFLLNEATKSCERWEKMYKDLVEKYRVLLDRLNKGV